MHTRAHQWGMIIIYMQSLQADLEDREARLRAQEEEMKERNAENNRLLRELKQYQTQLLGLQVQNDNYYGTPLNGNRSTKVTLVPIHGGGGGGGGGRGP